MALMDFPLHTSVPAKARMLDKIAREAVFLHVEALSEPCAQDIGSVLPVWNGVAAFSF